MSEKAIRSGETAGIIASSSLEEFFHEAVRGAMKRNGIEASEDAEHYLVLLLRRLATEKRFFGKRRSSGAASFPDTVAEAWLEAKTAEPTRREELIRWVGDYSLLLVGCFPEQLARRPVRPDYYIHFGRKAYHTLSAMGRPGAGRKIFRELSEGFERFSEVLSTVVERMKSAGKKRLDDAVLRWFLTGSRASRATLFRFGRIPIIASPRLLQ